MAREVRHRYDDPLDLVWLGCARACGIQVVRSGEVYASWNGADTLTLSTSQHFDADDSLAQLIFHELCHALVAGPKGARRHDWGMENVDERDLLQEHACHRLQATLADRYGLRALFAVTTEHRTYWDALPIDPLAPGDDPAIALARDGLERADQGPWAKPIAEALDRTARMAELVRESGVASDALWGLTQRLHASGFPLHADETLKCGACAWAYDDRGVMRCRHTRRGEHSRGRRVEREAPGCVRFEASFGEEECGACGACCREGFDRVEVRPSELVKKRHPELVSRDGYGEHLARPGGRCVALEGGGAGAYRCRVYAERPRSCADFAVRGDACLTARRRVGRSA
jgi:hypothetical protein